MVTAVVLIRVDKAKVNTVAETLARLEGIREVYSVAGRFDLVALIWVKDHEGVAKVVTDQMLKVDGIIESETLISFRVYSKEDREGIFSIGME
ncbi:Lrp/AsnC family transcriptional regulator [candidate division KSB1 bacterium]